jgi:hypothetical protein
MMMAPLRQGEEGHKDNNYSAIAATGGKALRQEADKMQQPKREQEGHKDDDNATIATNGGQAA